MTNYVSFMHEKTFLILHGRISSINSAVNATVRSQVRGKIIYDVISKMVDGIKHQTYSDFKNQMDKLYC